MKSFLILLATIGSLWAMGNPRALPAAGPPASGGVDAAPVRAVAPAKILTARESLMATAIKEVGTQEKTGHNDGPVDKYLASVGLGGTRNPYCAAFVYWTGRTALGARNPFPRSAWSPDFGSAPGARAQISTARAGDTFVIYHSSVGRIGHTGLVRGWQGRYLWTIEANTSPQASTGESDRNGDGVWSKLRDPRTIYRVKSWLP